ncbi:hypothetical protein BDN72DRAFT_902504 [Pluteus cervinus]|uniref:Uncharacterized protein n=1 Tax=Pluteus cervinus TaxID=181527 RepID=A0ACD3ACJ8_9AGAR|nr:hypothetical protein BDN72DRAFT_902504 [Pluteus cervinus]
MAAEYPRDFEAVNAGQEGGNSHQDALGLSGSSSNGGTQAQSVAGALTLTPTPAAGAGTSTPPAASHPNASSVPAQPVNIPSQTLSTGQSAVQTQPAASDAVTAGTGSTNTITAAAPHPNLSNTPAQNTNVPNQNANIQTRNGVQALVIIFVVVAHNGGSDEDGYDADDEADWRKAQVRGRAVTAFEQKAAIQTFFLLDVSSLYATTDVLSVALIVTDALPCSTRVSVAVNNEIFYPNYR